MTLSIKQRERERRAVRDYACPNTLCNQPKDEPCYTSRRQQGNRYIPAHPLVHPHRERVALVPDWTVGRRSFDEKMRERGGASMPSSLKRYAMVEDRKGNTYVVPVPLGHDVGRFKDMIEEELGVMTRGTVYHMSLTELRRRAKAKEMD